MKNLIIVFLLMGGIDLEGQVYNRQSQNQNQPAQTHQYQLPQLILGSSLNLRMIVPANNFHLNSDIGLSYRVIYNHKKLPITVMAGGKLWMNTSGEFARVLPARGWVQSASHMAIGLMYRFGERQSKDHQISYNLLGLSLSRMHYVESAQPDGFENVKYKEFSEQVKVDLPGVKGMYYSAPYFHFQREVRGKKAKNLLEANLLIPLKLHVLRMQYGGTVTTLARGKVIYGFKRWQVKADLQVNSIDLSYSPQLLYTTGNVEVAYSFIKDKNFSVSLVAGYIRGQHAFNFMKAVDYSDIGMWSAPFVGVTLTQNTWK